jgi:mono/diheme cytochrome c family protein
VEGTAPTDDESLRHGFGEYDEMCVVCHGAPGVRPQAIGRGLNPEPPDLAAPDAETNDAELFWIIDHGIKFTGMPGFGATHSKETVWALVAFVKRLPGMSPEEYARQRAEYAEHEEEAERAEGAEREDAAQHEHAGEHPHGG